MNAVKDVAAALGELINATKLASGKPIHDPAMNDLKESAKVCCSVAPLPLKSFSFTKHSHTSALFSSHSRLTNSHFYADDDDGHDDDASSCLRFLLSAFCLLFRGTNSRAFARN